MPIRALRRRLTEYERQRLHPECLFAGPFLGEFGWELFCFQGYVRQMARRAGRVIVASRPGHEALYEDFVDEYVEFTPPSGRADCQLLVDYDQEQLAYLVPEGAYWLKPYAIEARYTRRHCPVVANQEFIPFGSPTTIEYDLLLHARTRQAHEGRNWPPDAWEALLEGFPDHWRIAWIGTKQDAGMVPGRGVDLRGIPLAELIDVLRASRLILGPSSGPMHLAALCETPQVTWSGSKKDVVRYGRYWNPFGVPHAFLSTWEPGVEDVRRALDSMLQRNSE